MKIYEREQNKFEKEINSIYRKADLLGWEIPSSVKILNDMYKNSLDDFNKLDEVRKKIKLKNYLLMIQYLRIVFENRNSR